MDGSTGADFSVTTSAAASPDGLADYSRRDRVWDVHRSQAQDVEAIYASAGRYERYAQRMHQCSGELRFGRQVDPETGEIGLRLREAHFCRVRHCPVCQWRRSLLWLARFYDALPAVEAAHPGARWIFLTITVRNCDTADLRATLTAMNKAWGNLTRRAEFAQVLGWVRTTEVTRGKDGSAHPHFHTLMLVSPSMLSGAHYVKQERWVQLWRECAKLDYLPYVDVRGVKNRDKAKGEVLDPAAAVRKAAAETLKYAVKPGDMVADPAWFLAMTEQVHKLRFVATGGVLKDVLRVDDESQEDLVAGDSEGKGEDDAARLAFTWRGTERKYRRYPKRDVAPRLAG